MSSKSGAHAATVDEQFNLLVRELTASPEVSLAPAKKGFGSGTLQVHSRIFAMVTGGHVVIKLPAGRVASLIAQGRGLPFDAGKGRPMKEWIRVTETERESLLDLAREALDFVRSK